MDEFSIAEDCPKRYYEDYLDEDETLEEALGQDERSLYDAMGLVDYSEHYDSGGDFIGFELEDVEVYGDDFGDWLDTLDYLCTKFIKITGISPKLVGMQNIT